MTGFMSGRICGGEPVFISNQRAGQAVAESAADLVKCPQVVK
jgi:hypothetical protein